MWSASCSRPSVLLPVLIHVALFIAKDIVCCMLSTTGITPLHLMYTFLRVRSDELLYLSYGITAIEAERPILIPSKRYSQKYVIVVYVDRLSSANKTVPMVWPSCNYIHSRSEEKESCHSRTGSGGGATCIDDNPCVSAEAKHSSDGNRLVLREPRAPERRDRPSCCVDYRWYQ